MRGLNQTQKRIIQLRRQNLSYYRIAKTLNKEMSLVYRSAKRARTQIRKLAKDFQELGLDSSQLLQLLNELEKPQPRNVTEPELRPAY